MKRLFFTLAFCLFCSAVSARKGPEPKKVTWEQLPGWQEGYFEIHAISTGKGETAFYIFPDGTTMLVDAGDTSFNGWESEPFPNDSKRPGQWIAKYIKDYLGTDYVDYFLLSHFHGDHSGSTPSFRDGGLKYKLSGITDVGQEIRFGTIIDRGYPDYDFPSAGYVQREPTLNYIRFVQEKTGDGSSRAEQFSIGSHKQFCLKHNPKAYKDFDIWNLAANACISTGRGLKSRPMYADGDSPSKFDENMFSCVQLITYGDFTYFHGGDLPGGVWEPSKPTAFSRAYDSQVADLIGHPVNVMKACHHGTKDTSSPHFLWTLRPEAVLFLSCNNGHPSALPVERMLDPLMPGCKDLYSTSDVCAQRLGPLWDQFKGWGHIIIRVAPHGSSYEIFIVDPHEPTAAR